MMTWWRTCLCQSTLIQKGTSTWLLTCLHSLSGQIWGQDSVVPMVRGAVSLYLTVPDSAHQNQLSGVHRDTYFFISYFFLCSYKETWKWCWVCQGCLHVPSWSRGFPENHFLWEESPPTNTSCYFEFQSPGHKNYTFKGLKSHLIYQLITFSA